MQTKGETWWSGVNPRRPGPFFVGAVSLV